MIFSYPSVTIIDNELKFEDGKYCQLPDVYKKEPNREILVSFYRSQLESKKGCCEPTIDSDPIGFDFVILDYICYVGLIINPENSAKKKNNRKKFPNNKFSKDYILGRIVEEYDLLNLNKYIPVKSFTQSIHELRGLNSKISGHIDNLMKFSSEEEWDKQFDSANDNMKKIYVGTRLIKFLLDNIRLFNPQNIKNLQTDLSFNFIAHRSINKIVKIYRNDFSADKAEIEFKGNSYRKISGEKEYFEILIKILIENALKFSSEKRIGPKVWIKDINESDLHIGVESYGRLIPAEERKDIFTRGYRSEVHRNSKGTGMGLYIAKNISKLFNIEIDYIAQEVSEDKSIKLGWNKFILHCSNTISNGK